jgi:hypothetical protein
MTIGNFSFYLQKRLIQTSQTGGQWYSDTSPFSIPWFESNKISHISHGIITLKVKGKLVLLVLTSSAQLLLILKIYISFFTKKLSYEEVNCTEPSVLTAIFASLLDLSLV